MQRPEPTVEFVSAGQACQDLQVGIDGFFELIADGYLTPHYLTRRHIPMIDAAEVALLSMERDTLDWYQRH